MLQVNIPIMESKYRSSYILLFITLITLLSGCGESLAVKTQMTATLPASTPTPSSVVHTLQLQIGAKPASVPATKLKSAIKTTHKIAPTPVPGTKVAPTPAPSVGTAPVNTGMFTTLPPGSTLPSDATCAARVRLSAWEPRPDNATANHTNVYLQGYRLTGSNLGPYGYQARVTGNFTGTTDEVLQWGACKWGIDENIVRAQAEQESHWHQSTLGDCLGGSVAATHGCQSVGILQIKGANIPATHPGTWPYAYQSTAFNVDYMLGMLRSCYEGKETWLGNGYHAGDIWGCVGRWFSGDWYGNSLNYISIIQRNLANKDWLKSGF
jgi:hypothetical protein